MSIEDEIRRIAREEIARMFKIDDLAFVKARPIVPRYESRSGCTCDPTTRSTCPSPTCPWRPA